MTGIPNTYHRLWAFGLTLALFGTSYLTVGWWTDSYQSMYDTVVSGELTGYHLPTGDPFSEYMPGAAHIFTLLGRLLPIKWVALMLNGLLFLSICVIYLQVLRNTEGIPLWNRAAIIVFLTAFFVESVVLYHMVRITMFLGVAGLSNILFSQRDDGRFLSRSGIPYLMLFAIALWVRCNVHLFVLMLVTLAFLVHRRPIRPLMPYWILLSVALLYYFKTVFWTDYSDDLYHSFLYDLEFRLQFVGAYRPTLMLENAMDSLKYQAVMLNFFGDEQHLNHEFFTRTGMLTNHSRVSYDQLIYALHVFKESIWENIYFLIADVVLIVSYLILGGKAMPHYRAKTLFLFIMFYALLLAISFIKMENRFMVPFQILFLLTMMFMHRPKLFYHRPYLPLLVLFLVLYIPLTAYYTSQKIGFAKNKTRSYEQVFDWMGREYASHVVVFNTAFITFERPHQIFDKTQMFSDFFMFNYYSCQLSPYYRPFLEEKCQCDIGEFYTFYRYLRERPEEVLLLDYPDRIVMLGHYLREVNGYSLYFEQISVPGNVQEDLGELGFDEGLSLFRMVKD